MQGKHFFALRRRAAFDLMQAAVWPYAGQARGILRTQNTSTKRVPTACWILFPRIFSH
jgi:hypothetical protein